LSSTDSNAARTPPSDPKPARSARASGRGPQLSHSIRPERRRLSAALLLSLLVHALLLSLSFGGQGLGLPGLGFPWRDRRIEVPDLRVVLVPARVTAAEPTLIEQPVDGGPALTPSVSPALTLGKKVAAIVREAKPTVSAMPPVNPKPTAVAKPKPEAATGAVSAKAPSSADGPGHAAPPPIPEPAVIALESSDAAALVVPVAPPLPTPVIAAAPSASSPEAVMPAPRDAGDAAQEQIYPEARERVLELAKLDRAEQEAQRHAEQMEAARQEAARQEAARGETARLEAERQEAARQGAARQETARQEAARQEVERGETARLEAERQEAARQATARQETARQEAARQEVERGETARLEAERQEAARQGAARQEAAREEQEARRNAARRAMGRQLDEEAARREAASLAARPSPTLPPTSSSARRGRLFGRTDPNTELILYAEAWGRKIQLNMTFDMVREAAKQPHTNPLVTVALRSDGSVESVTFVLSSGVAGIDEAIRRIVQSQAPYPAFPPGLAREFDVIEIRRTWIFDMAIRLY
jgi:hypothetical protein